MNSGGWSGCGYKNGELGKAETTGERNNLGSHESIEGKNVCKAEVSNAQKLCFKRKFQLKDKIEKLGNKGGN